MKSVDLIILGDGLIARLACVCASHFGLSFIRIGKREPEYALDPRSYAIAPSSLKFLSILGVSFNEPQVKSIEIGFGEALNSDLITIMGEAGPRMTMVDHNQLLQALSAGLDERDFMDEQSPKIDIDEHFAVLPEHDIKAVLIIIAEGKNADNAKALGISYRSSPYQQLAITAKIKGSLAHQSIARQLFSPTGPLGILPHGTHECSIVWSQDLAVAQALLELSDPDFLSTLEDKISRYTGNLEMTAKRSAFPLSHITPSRLFGKRFVLAGDSAHVVHPLAGQGLNLGIRDIACLFETIVPARRIGQDIGADDLVARYASWRKADIAQISMLTKSLQKFGSSAWMAKPLIKQFAQSFSSFSGGNLTSPSALLNGKAI